MLPGCHMKRICIAFVEMVFVAAEPYNGRHNAGVNKSNLELSSQYLMKNNI